MFTEVVKLSERGQRHYSHHNDVLGFDSSSAILKIEWRVAGQVHTAHVQRFFRPVLNSSILTTFLPFTSHCYRHDGVPLAVSDFEKVHAKRKKLFKDIHCFQSHSFLSSDAYFDYKQAVEHYSIQQHETENNFM